MPLDRLLLILFGVIAGAGVTVAVAMSTLARGLGGTGSGLVLAAVGALVLAALIRLVAARRR